LIKRTTRKLFVTEEGRSFFDRCIRGLKEIRAAEEEVTMGQREPHGLLRVTAPIELGGSILPKVISEFHSKYPKVHFDLYLSDRTVDLISEGFDLAVRAGDLRDSSLMAKKLGSVYFAPFASPQYLKKRGTPGSPKELRDHSCLQFTPLGLDEWKLVGPKGSVSIPMSQQLVINELNVIKNLAVSGLGIALLPTFFCYSDVQGGKLVRILPEWRSNLRPVHFVYVGQKYASPKINAFMSIASDMIKNSLQTFEL
jgi:DNA-binding transcriptional LysR family regulator